MKGDQSRAVSKMAWSRGVLGWLADQMGRYPLRRPTVARTNRVQVWGGEGRAAANPCCHEGGLGVGAGEEGKVKRWERSWGAGRPRGKEMARTGQVRPKTKDLDARLTWILTNDETVSVLVGVGRRWPGPCFELRSREGGVSRDVDVEGRGGRGWSDYISRTESTGA